MWKLTIEDDEGKRTPLPLFRDEYTIGRSEENTVRLTERNISRKHARLKKNGVGWVLQDLSSYNGSFVNGTRVATEQALSHGDILQLGDYRLEFADDAVATHAPDTSATATAPTGGVAAVKPDRLVVVAGPAPGQEFLIHSASMLIGRATEVDVSLPHVSVSRVHAEIHALGGNRYEIIDKGSANGVRVNGTQLGRALLEAGDFIELGEVRLKFVGAGQVYWPGAEAIKLSPETPEIQTGRPPPPSFSGAPARIDDSFPTTGRRTLGKNVLMGAAGGAIAIVTMLGVRQFRGGRPPVVVSAPPPVATAVIDPTKIAFDDIRKLAANGDLDLAHNKIASSIPSSSPLRESPELREIEARWADALLGQADQETDPPTRKMLLNTVAQSTTVDAVRRRVAADRLREMDERGTDVSELPHATRSTAAASEPAAARPTRAVIAPDPYVPPPAAPKPPPVVASEAPVEPKTAASDLALQGREGESRARAQLEPKVWSGKATPDEVRMLRAICRHQGDRSCSDRASALLSK